MLKRAWRQFRPQNTAQTVHQGGDSRLVDQARSSIDLAIRQAGLTRRRLRTEHLEPVIEILKLRSANEGTAAVWFALLIAQAPRAARAQAQMDGHAHGYQNKQARLFELIDFNDAFVSTVLALPDTELEGFVELARHELARFCAQVRGTMFSEQQYEAITRGLSREVAVYRGALLGGYRAEMTSRTQDALGVDMVVTDPATKQSINIDCKTSSSYRYRLQDLVREGRLSEDDALRADEIGYAWELNGNDSEQVEVVLMRIDPNELGDIKDFEFVEPERLTERFRTIFSTMHDELGH